MSPGLSDNPDARPRFPGEPPSDAAAAWEESARQFALNADYWRERCEQAEARNERIAAVVRAARVLASQPSSTQRAATAESVLLDALDALTPDDIEAVQE